jgi:hypothetical protein
MSQWLVVPTAQAVSRDFGCITCNVAGNCAIGKAQLAVDVSDRGKRQVLFLSLNTESENASITGVYFDDGTLPGLSGLIDANDDALGSFGDPGMDFSPGASPGDLPGGSAVGFIVTTGFLGDSDPPAEQDGVNPGETLGVVFALQAGGTYQDLIGGLIDGSPRIGVHAPSIGTGGSESFVNARPLAPEPGSALLLGLGLACLARTRP